MDYGAKSQFTGTVQQDYNGGGAGTGMYDYYDKDCPDFNYKLILVGSARVGKTSLINRFINDQFNDQEASSKTVQISKKMVKI
jgi:GTPase SAR1 family protein